MERHRYGTLLVIAALALVGATGWLAAGGTGALDRDGDDHHRAFAYALHHGDEPGGWIGVTIDEPTDRVGALIVSVVDDSPAEQAGLRRGDVVIGLDGRDIRSPRGLIERVADREPGDSVELEIERDGSRQSVRLELGENPRGRIERFEWSGDSREEFEKQMEQLREQLGEMEFDFDFDMPDAPNAPMPPMRFHFGNDHLDMGPFGHGQHRPRLGVELTEVTDELREHLGGSRDVGVLVGRLIAGMPAEAAGIEVGDLIESVDGETIEDSRDLVRALDDREGDTLRIGIVRERRSMTIDVTLPEPEDEPRARGPRA